MNKLGFGFLRLPEKDGQIDYKVLNQMTDDYIALGGRYFDTAYTYLDGESEIAIGKSLAARYPREAFQLTTKLPGYMAQTREDCRRMFEESAARCGVDYFDTYMLHWLNQKHYRIAQQQDQFGFLQELKAAGKAKRIGFSFHDTPELLDQILTEHPETDCVLLQINYLDYDAPGIQSRECYEVAVKHGKSVIVMEPVKGGRLAAVPSEAEALLKTISDDSPAFQAIRFAQSLPMVETVLSGMSTPEQLKDNMRHTEPMTQQELDIMAQAAKIIQSVTGVDCTGCGYCVKHCPMELPIPKLFGLYNTYMLYTRHLWKVKPAYRALAVTASACVSCGSCAEHCPQKLPIPEHMQTIAGVFEK